MKNKWFTAHQKELLEDSLKTEQPITFKAFRQLIKSKLYVFYAFDNRINANVYILTQIDKNLGLPTWLHEYK